MGKYFSTYVVSADGADCFIPIGWCPEKVTITALDDGQANTWYRMLGNDGALVRAAAGDITITTDKGIKLVKFEDSSDKITSDPSAVDPGNWIDANGIQITGDVAFLGDDEIVFVEAWGMDRVWIKATHDGTTSSNTYFEDGSYDFLELGVSGNGQWLIYNLTNTDYAWIKDVVKPADSSKHCRLYTATDAIGTATTAADFDTGDVCYIFEAKTAQYPMSDMTGGIMT